MATPPSHARALSFSSCTQPDLVAAVLELPLVILVLVDAAGTIVAASPAACNAAGYTANELIGQPLLRLQSPFQDPAVLAGVLAALTEGEIWEGELWWSSRDGQQRAQRLSVRRLSEREGDAYYLISGLDTGMPTASPHLREGTGTVDTLTRLPGRLVFEDRLAQALKQARRRGTILAVMKLELDRLSDINTLLGDALGDQVLCEVAALLDHVLRDGDTVARTGTYEFGLILPDLEDYESAAQVAQKIQRALGVPLVLHEREMHLVSNIGISLYPKDGNEASLLIRHADSALNNLREEERGGYRFFAKAMNVRALERMMLHNSILGGLLREEFLLHYQPQVAFTGGQILGLEALIRWQHPDLGLVPPVKFISIAEQTGTIVPLGEWVLRKACAQCMAWRQLSGKAVRIAVNISVRQLRSGSLSGCWSRSWRKPGCPLPAWSWS